MAQEFHLLTLSDVHRETEKAVTLSFHIPEELTATFAFEAGQYLTLQTTVHGKQVRRAYSLCSSPASGQLSVTVKEVEKGVFSSFANTQLKKGDTIEVAAPEGRFLLDSAYVKAQRNYLAFAAGSGITPIMSMIRSVLVNSEDSSIVLVYGNKSPQDTIFREELMRLRDAYKNRFSIEFIYSRSREDGAHFGRIMRSTVNFVMKNKYAAKNFDHVYLCGPEGMIHEVSDALKSNGLQADQIHYELFTASTEVETSVNQELVKGATQVKIICDDEEAQIEMSQTDYILDAALDNDIDAPYSCQGGICSSCIARVTEGTAVMEKNQILTDSEVAEGLILTCQAHPTSETLVVDYDDV